MATALQTHSARGRTATSAGITRTVSASAWGALLTLTLATALVTTPWQDIKTAAVSEVPLAGHQSGGPDLSVARQTLAATPTSEQVPVEYLVGSEPEAAWMQSYVVDALVRRELPAGSRVLVVGRDADAATALATVRAETSLPEVQLVDLRAR
jgi:hypothetical protein